MSQPVGDSGQPEQKAEAPQRGFIARLLNHSAVRFLAVGGFSWAVDLGVLLLLVTLGVPVWLAAAIAWSTGFLTNYVLNRIWSFERKATWGASAWKYVALAAANALITVGIMEIAGRMGANLGVTKTALTAALAVVNYFAYRFWVFSASSSESPAPR